VFLRFVFKILFSQDNKNKELCSCGLADKVAAALIKSGGIKI
jgi:hypothetical protein